MQNITKAFPRLARGLQAQITELASYDLYATSKFPTYSDAHLLFYKGLVRPKVQDISHKLPLAQDLLKQKDFTAGVLLGVPLNAFPPDLDSLHQKDPVAPILETKVAPLLLPAFGLYNEAQAKAFNSANKPRFRVLGAVWNAPENKVIVEQWMDNPVLRGLAKDPESVLYMCAFREYLKQDYWYLNKLVKFREERLTHYEDNHGSLDIERKNVAKLKEYISGKEVEGKKVDGDFEIMLKALNIYDEAKAVVSDETLVNPATKKYGDWMMDKALNLKKGWYALHLIGSPCSYGWSMIGQDIAKQPGFKREGVLWECFVKDAITDNVPYDGGKKDKDGKPKASYFQDETSGSGTAKRNSEILDNLYDPASTLTEAEAIQLFGEGLQLEYDMFMAALEKCHAKAEVKDQK